MKAPVTRHPGSLILAHSSGELRGLCLFALKPLCGLRDQAEKAKDSAPRVSGTVLSFRWVSSYSCLV